MRIEDRLQLIIKEKYGKMSVFSKELNIPYTTLKSIFEREDGIFTASFNNTLKICEKLQIDPITLYRERKLVYKRDEILYDLDNNIIKDSISELKEKALIYDKIKDLVK